MMTRALNLRIFSALGATLALAATPGMAQEPFTGGLGETVTYEGGDVTLTLLFQDALYENQLFVFHSAMGNTFDPANAISVFSNKAAIGSTFTFNPGADYGLAVGEELIFGICANIPAGDMTSCGAFGNTNGIHYTGPESRNFDGVAHARVVENCGQAEICGSFTGLAVGFEDIREIDPPLSIDRDFNDLVFGVQQNPTTVIPEPVTMSLLATGLAGMSGATALRKRRRRQ